ncbi:MAG: prolyl oligopeptidase family serine peptidase [Vicinamibacterales bacterium]
MGRSARSRHIVLVIAAGVAVVASTGPGLRARQAAPFTVEQILGAPFPSELVAAPSGARVAWVFDDRGVRNIWVAEGPAFAGRRLTAYQQDDGQEITGLAFAPDGATLVYVRGGAANRAGEVPNPTSDAAGAEQAVWAVPVAGGAPRKLGVGSGAAISPTGDQVAFVQRGQLWLAGLSGTPAAVQAVRARGSARSLRWAPDGARLAFVSGRGDHAFIGVVDVATRALTWLDPSLDLDDAPVWSPDGTRVAFIRRPAVRDRVIFHPEREGHPWSIRVAAVGSGTGRQVWRAAEGRGSVFQPVEFGPQLAWSADQRLVFPWERDGWKHLYSVPAAGGDAVLLTPGAFEVDDVSYAPDGRTAVVSSNQDDIDRRHLWRVATGGGVPPVALTPGRGLEWNPVVLADGTSVAFVRADARRPGQPALLAAGAPPRDLAPGAIPAAFPAAALVEPEAVSIVASDGMRIPGQIFRPSPPAAAGQKRPALIFFHGGSRRQMLLGWNYRSYYHNAYAFNQLMASRGYVVLSVNYRSGIGYGLEFREALNYGASGASEYHDVVGAGLFLRAQPDVDPARIGLWGGSYGGYLTAMGLARASNLFAAGVDVHGVHDWNNAIRNFMPGYDAERRPEVARLAAASSPMAFLDGWRSPVLLIHGDDDRNVPFGESVELVEQLRARDVHVEQLVFPDEVHGFLLYRSWTRAYTAAADFLDRHLRVRPNASQQ